MGNERVIDEAHNDFTTFASSIGARVRAALVARFGLEVGVEVAADALAQAWERWDEVRAMANPAGYLFRIGQSAARRHHRWQRSVVLPIEVSAPEPMVEPRLDGALAQLPWGQRVAVLLVHGFGFSYQETADVLEVPTSTVRNWLHRGLSQLRAELGEA